LEVFVLDIELEAKPAAVQFELVKWLREIKKFDSVDELTEQIGRDVEQTKSVLRRA
jgi:FAD synthase